MGAIKSILDTDDSIDASVNPSPGEITSTQQSDTVVMNISIEGATLIFSINSTVSFWLNQCGSGTYVDSKTSEINYITNNYTHYINILTAGNAKCRPTYAAGFLLVFAHDI